ncbi:hypothetical protein E2C01_001485 [Portunus trituberculatus]|uniref:Uncharacterized protein n=1 Tax=Portunus trituberculatus TaxID=210409 RepID=A0A5B7CHS5_PORTR|nr:hypothetical protein [Portunus trituberculatus]
MFRYCAFEEQTNSCPGFRPKSSFSETTCKTNNPDEQVRTDPYGMTLGRGVRRAACGVRGMPRALCGLLDRAGTYSTGISRVFDLRQKHESVDVGPGQRQTPIKIPRPERGSNRRREVPLSSYYRRKASRAQSGKVCVGEPGCPTRCRPSLRRTLGGPGGAMYNPKCLGVDEVVSSGCA